MWFLRLGEGACLVSKLNFRDVWETNRYRKTPTIGSGFFIQAN